MPPRRRHLAAAVVTAAALIAPAAAVASLAQPAIVDAAGDAPNRFNTNQAAVDVLSADITTDGTTLRVRWTFAGTPRLTADTRYQFSTSSPLGDSTAYDHLTFNPVTRTPIRVRVTGNQARIGDGLDDDVVLPDPPDSRYDFAGTASVSGRSIIATFSLAQLNATYAGLGIPSVGAGTPLNTARGEAWDFSTNLFGQPTLRAARDHAFGAAPFTLGGD